MGKKIISFCLYNKRFKDIVNGLINCILAPVIYPGWICRWYVDCTIPVWMESALRSFPHCEVVVMPEHQPGLGDGMFWRFLPACDGDVEAMISRDADSWISAMEAKMVQDWLESGKQFHIMRTHCYHSQIIMGGVWSCLGGVIPQMQDLMNGYLKTNTYDQKFLAEQIYPLVQHNVLIHDPYTNHSKDEGKQIPAWDESLDEAMPGFSFLETHRANAFKCCHCQQVHQTYVGAILSIVPDRAMAALKKYLDAHNIAHDFTQLN